MNGDKISGSRVLRCCRSENVSIPKSFGEPRSSSPSRRSRPLVDRTDGDDERGVPRLFELEQRDRILPKRLTYVRKNRMNKSSWRTHAFSFCSALVIVLNCAAPNTVSADEPPRTVRVLNKGVGGNNTHAGLARFAKDVVAHKPDHLILYFGINDACNSRRLIPPDQFRKNLQAMIDRSPTRSIVLVTPNPVIPEYLAQRHPAHPHKDDLQANLDRYERVIRETAKQNQLLLVDLHKLVNRHGGATLDKPSLVRNTANSNSRDGVHLTPRGYQFLARQIAALLKDRIQPGQTIVCLGDSLTYGAHVQGAGTATGQTYPARLAELLNAGK